MKLPKINIKRSHNIRNHNNVRNHYGFNRNTATREEILREQERINNLTDEELEEEFGEEDLDFHELYYRDPYLDDDDDIPEGCAACGGPYPSCMTSCSLFDD